MIVDIREDIPDFMAYIRRRVDQHVAMAGKRKNMPPVKMITFGFEFGQANWLALVFDTRPDAEPDGEWTRDIKDSVMLKRPNWPIWDELPDDAVVHFVDIAGKKINVMSDPDSLICGIVGDAMKQALLQARQDGVFAELPKTDDCELGVENLEGFYGWPNYEDRGKENRVEID